MSVRAPRNAGEEGLRSVYIVTGGGSGIGKAVCASLVRDSAVVLVDHDRRSARLAVDELQLAGQVEMVIGDVADRATAEAAVRAAEGLGSLRGLVNNAGIINDDAEAHDLSLENLDAVIATNFRGAFVMAQTVGKSLFREGGSIVNMSSMAGLGGIGRRSVYGPSKAAVDNLTRTLAVEWGPRGVRVNSIAPGYIRTTGLDYALAHGYLDVDALTARTPLRKLGSEEDVVALVRFLLSDSAAFITGSTLVVDGGWSAQLGL